MGRQEFHLFRGILRPGMTVLDIGANQGVFTLYCADRVGSTGKVIAFEPDREMFSALEANVKANGKTWVELHHLAVGAGGGLDHHLVPPRHHRHARLLRRDRCRLGVARKLLGEPRVRADQGQRFK